jgi:hypothetical protein
LSDKIYDATITPNRSNPKRFVQLVVYQREGDRVSALLYRKNEGEEATAEPLPYGRIRGCSVDSEFAEAWQAHIWGKQGQLTLAERRR